MKKLKKEKIQNKQEKTGKSKEFDLKISLEKLDKYMKNSKKEIALIVKEKDGQVAGNLVLNMISILIDVLLENKTSDQKMQLVGLLTQAVFKDSAPIPTPS